jgi:hypothetical protein
MHDDPKNPAPKRKRSWGSSEGEDSGDVSRSDKESDEESMGTDDEDSDDEVSSYKHCVEDNADFWEVAMHRPSKIDNSLYGRRLLFCWGHEEYGWLLARVTGYKADRKDDKGKPAPFDITFNDVERLQGKEFCVNLPKRQYGKTSLVAWNWVLVGNV